MVGILKCYVSGFEFNPSGGRVDTRQNIFKKIVASNVDLLRLNVSKILSKLFEDYLEFT